MFYSHSVLARKSPLGTVWIAAHLERKAINRTQIDGVDVPSYAASIMDPEVPIALRISAHLLLGLVRIYSWKVNHLFHDCNRMLSDIRTAAFAAAAAIDLPFDADRAPFEMITLPPTFSLDDWNLDDAIRQMETPDNHRRTPDQITLSAEQKYVTVDLDDQDTPSTACRYLSFEQPEPHEQVTFPPLPEDAIFVDPPPGDTIPNTDNEHQDSPEILRGAPESATRFTDDSGPIDNASPFKETPPSAIMYSSLSHDDGGSLLGTSIIPNDPMEEEDEELRNVPRGIIHDPMEEDEDQGGSGIPVPALLMLEPAPTPLQDNKRKRKQNAQENTRPRVDDIFMLSNDDMRAQVEGHELPRLVRRKKQLPLTAVDVWRKFDRKGSLFSEPLVQGMCSDLHKAYEANYPRVSDSDADVANIGDEDATPGNAGTHKEPEPNLTPMSSGNGEATPLDHSAPELPRCSTQTGLSPVREYDDSPFKTPGVKGTQESELGGTGTATASVPQTNGSFASPGQNTRESEFPFGADYLDQDLPEIPGLMNTPSIMSSPGTGGTGLGTMSARTRAAARYFKGKMSSAISEDQRGKLSLNMILDGRTRRQAASMFFEALALKSSDYIDVHQEKPYGDISVSVRISLSSAKL